MFLCAWLAEFMLTANIKELFFRFLIVTNLAKLVCFLFNPLFKMFSYLIYDPLSVLFNNSLWYNIIPTPQGPVIYFPIMIICLLDLLFYVDSMHGNWILTDKTHIVFEWYVFMHIMAFFFVC